MLDPLIADAFALKGKLTIIVCLAPTDSQKDGPYCGHLTRGVIESKHRSFEYVYPNGVKQDTVSAHTWEIQCAESALKQVTQEFPHRVTGLVGHSLKTLPNDKK